MREAPYIDALNKELGLDITLPASGGIAFSLEGRNMLLQWVEATQVFVVYVEIGALGGWRNGTICRQLLAANFLFIETQGGTLSYNEATQMVGLNVQLPIHDLETNDFLAALNHCVLCAETWRSRLETMNREQEREVEAEQASIGAETAADEIPYTQFLRV